MFVNFLDRFFPPIASNLCLFNVFLFRVSDLSIMPLLWFQYLLFLAISDLLIKISLFCNFTRELFWLISCSQELSCKTHQMVVKAFVVPCFLPGYVFFPCFAIVGSPGCMSFLLHLSAVHWLCTCPDTVDSLHPSNCQLVFPPRARGCALWSEILSALYQRSLPPDWNWDFHHHYGYFPQLSV